MEFLQKIFFGNTILGYLLVGATILFVLLFKKFISRYVASFICEIVRRNWPTIKREQFISLIIKPLNSFLIITISVFAISTLEYPEEINAPIFNTTLHHIFQKIGLALIIIAVIKMLVSIVSFISLLLKEHHNDQSERAHFQLILFFKDFIKAILYIIGFVLLLKYIFTVNVGALVGGLGIAGAALALAGRESIENIIASFIIFLDKPFYTGDLVKVNSYTGTVERIGLRSTRVRTADKTLITVPNKQMVDSVVDNLSFRTFRRGEIKFELPALYTAEKVQEFVDGAEDLIQQKKEELTDYTLFVTEYSKNGITVTLEFFTLPVGGREFNAIRQRLMMGAMKLMEEKKTEFSNIAGNVTIIQPNAGTQPPASDSII